MNASVHRAFALTSTLGVMMTPLSEILLNDVGDVEKKLGLVALYALVAVSSSNLADLDSETTKVSRQLPGIAKGLQRLKEKTWELGWFKHRHITHSLFIPLMTIIAAVFSFKTHAMVGHILTAFSIGYLSHIIADLFSGEVYLFLPFINRPFSFIPKESALTEEKQKSRYKLLNLCGGIIAHVSNFALLWNLTVKHLPLLLG